LTGFLEAISVGWVFLAKSQFEKAGKLAVVV